MARMEKRSARSRTCSSTWTARSAVAVEVGGFLGIGDKDVLVGWSALEITREGDDIRVMGPTLTREVLEGAAAVDLDKLGLGSD